MPIYEYLCDDCGARYERLVMSKDQVIACPKCSSERRTLQLSVFRSANKSSSGGNTPSFPGGSCGCGPTTCGCN